jgi:ketosteroid isomerase-like protein
METRHLVPLDNTLLRLFEAGAPNSHEKARERALVDSASRLFAAVVSSDYDALEAEMADGVIIELFSPPEFPFIRNATGKQEARTLIAHNFSTLTEQVPEILSLTAQGNHLVLVGREAGKVRATDQPYEVQFVYCFTYQEDKLAQICQYVSYPAWRNPPRPTDVDGT